MKLHREKIVGYVDVFRKSSQGGLSAEIYLNRGDKKPKYYLLGNRLPKKIDQLFGEKIRTGNGRKPFFKIECTAQIEKGGDGIIMYLKNMRNIKELIK